MTHAPIGAGAVRVTFLGTSSLLVRDERSAFLVDGFLSRPSLLRVAVGRIAPDPRRIDAALARCGIDRAEAVLVAHSHHDHAMDAPTVARRLGATLHGSPSTLQIGTGAGMAERSMRRFRHGDAIVIGAFRILVAEGVHSTPDRLPGMIDEPLRPPVRASRYREGGAFSFHVAHPDGTMLVHPSAGIAPHSFDDLAASVVYLGVGGIGRRSAREQRAYWRHVVTATGARLVVPVHWDDFGRSLAHPLQPFPRLLDRGDRALEMVDAMSTRDGLRWHLPAAFETIAPFAMVDDARD
ncbi:MBL fold metallo-hydrolase [Agrococcus jejuensis]|uniref:L-ascorbate metabolism protein UlaG, beta-lactamase superfamily n=1 Tax=Agrococcus jejuensis TaxID=399736 RepID=A0A1G8DZC4_9MICO|nr:MBL fold metallo-hydrolase [Agrococcus jejuensis]SDH62935.1 L-ascorbate metabolism protein UlaG, beta-lactamase superfamily [Agrococcus jejuensis]